MDTLPPEVIDLIIDEVTAPKDYRNLLVLSRKWYSIMICRREKDMLCIGTNGGNGHILPNGNAHGLHECSFLDGGIRLHEQITYVNGMEQGIQRLWYPDGQLRFEVNYVNGKKIGILRLWYPDGQLRFEVNYVNGKKVGIERDWSENGRLVYRSHITDGIRESWDKDGSPMYREHIKDSKTHGLHEAWFRRGTKSLRFRGKYINDKAHGIHELFEMDGSLLARRKYHLGVLVESSGATDARW